MDAPGSPKFLAFFGCIFIFSIFWYSIDVSKESTPDVGSTTGVQPSKQERNTISPLNWTSLKPTMLDRMSYEKPYVDKPKRVDVMMMTPWLAPIIWDGTFNSDILNAQHHKKGTRIGLTVFAIKKYITFLQTFLETAEQFFMVGHQVTIYVFTDQPGNIPQVRLGEKRQLIVLEVPSHQRWQDVTMRRMQMIRDYTEDRFFKEVDYLVCVDVDLKFLAPVGVEILGDLVGTIHPSFCGAPRDQFTNERRPESTAYIPRDEGDFYYAGGFFGGNIEEVYQLTNHCHEAMMADKEKNLEAIWHDESYLNKYFLYHKPTKLLSPEYLWNYAYAGPNVVKVWRVVTIQKNDAYIRS